MTVMDRQVEHEQVLGLLQQEEAVLLQLLEISRQLNETIQNHKQLDAAEAAKSLMREQAAVARVMEESRKQWRVLFPQRQDFRAWCRHLPVEQKAPVLECHANIRSLMSEIHGVNLGTQTVLVYTTNYYSNFLAGVSRDGPSETRYSANGLRPQQQSGFFETDC